MILTMERVISPGWLTQTFENELTGEWFCYHRCVDCGMVIGGASLQPGRDLLMEHAAEKHKAAMFAFELYRFRAALHGLDVFFGLEALEWPDRLPTEFFPLLRMKGLLK